MSSYVISCCSTADLTEEHFSKREISYICFHYKLNDTEYADDLGKSMPFDQFYAAMAAGASTKTSQVNADEFEAINEQISNFAQTYPTNLKASSNEALLFMRRYRFANCSCFSCCFKDAYPSSNVQ